jgi:hypothetical protein
VTETYSAGRFEKEGAPSIPLVPITDNFKAFGPYEGPFAYRVGRETLQVGEGTYFLVEVEEGALQAVPEDELDTIYQRAGQRSDAPQAPPTELDPTADIIDKDTWVDFLNDTGGTLREARRVATVRCFPIKLEHKTYIVTTNGAVELDEGTPIYVAIDSSGNPYPLDPDVFDKSYEYVEDEAENSVHPQQTSVEDLADDDPAKEAVEQAAEASPTGAAQATGAPEPTGHKAPKPGAEKLAKRGKQDEGKA